MATSVEPVVPKQEMIQKSYFDVLALCCSSEVALVERILGSIEGVKDVSVIVPSKTVIVVHDSLLVTASDIARSLNQARLEANVKMNAGQVSHRNKWPSPYVMASGALLAISLFKFVYHPLQWVALGAVAVGIWPIFMRAFAAVRNLTLDINILVLIAVAGTLALRDYIEAGVIVFLFTIAEWLQSRASHKATAVMSSLLNIAPQKATIAETGEEVNVEEVQLNTILAVKAGQAIPIDGIVVEGSCEVDEKALTGEAFPVAKQKDSTVLAGTMNLNGYISVKTTALAEDCAVAKMAKLVEEAQRKRPKFQKLIDECAKYYTPAVFLLSAGLAGIPAALRVHNQNYWFHLALVVLVSGCPCGLILSTPVATFCALSKAAATGLLIKGGDYMENLAKIKVVAFDKTGTITRGEFNMKGFQSLSKEISTNKLLYWVTSLESKSSHPIADAVVNYGRSQSIEPKPDMVEDFLIFTGEGVSGKIDGTEIFVGNRKLGHRAGCVTGPETESNVDGRTLGFVYCGGVVIGTFSLFDSCRSGAIDAVNDLKSMGIRTAMLTGDSNAAATHAQTQLRNALDVVHAELLPEDKARIIEEYKKSVGPTAMVGDGINDAPALAMADVGISMGVSGSALATETGHVILMSNDISKIPKAIKLAKKTQRKVIENIVFSVAIKAAVLAAAFAGYAIVWVAVLADVLTCLLVILNSMTLLRQKGHGSSSKSRHHGHGHGHGSCQKGTCHDEEPGSHHHHHHNGHHHHHVHHHGSLRLRKHCHHHHDDVGSLSTRPLIVNSHHHHHHDADHSSVLATHDHHGHEHNKQGSCSTHDHHGHEHNKLGSCSMVNGSAAVKRESEIIECPSGKGSSNTCSKTTMGKADGCSSLSTSTCKIQECSSGSALAGKCCESVDCSDIINDPCDSMDECDECNLSSSMARPSCEKDKCRDLEGQDGCLRGEDCGLREADKRSTVENGRDCQLICCTADHAEEEIDKSGIIKEARGHCSSRKETVCLNGAGSDGVVSLAPAGNKHSVCCRSFTEECCRIHKHLHANFVAGFGEAS